MLDEKKIEKNSVLNAPQNVSGPPHIHIVYFITDFIKVTINIMSSNSCVAILRNLACPMENLPPNRI